MKMSEKKTLEERYGSEILTDNTKISKYKQCKDCSFRKSRINGVLYDDYRKTCCMIFPYPEMKPIQLYNGSTECEYYEKD